MAIQYTSEEKKYVLLKGNILKRMEAERVSMQAGDFKASDISTALRTGSCDVCQSGA